MVYVMKMTHLSQPFKMLTVGDKCTQSTMSRSLKAKQKVINYCLR